MEPTRIDRLVVWEKVCADPRCGTLFATTVRQQKYCPGAMGKPSRCAARVRQRRFKRARKDG